MDEFTPRLPKGARTFVGTMDKLRKLPGTQDLQEGPWLALKGVQDRLRDLFSNRGYQVIDTPILEPTELFFRKGGGEMAAQMYSFADPGGNQVSLRPEFTSSIVRHCIEMDPSPVLPWRAQYTGPVFRHSGEGQDYRQFHQAGVELIGSSHPRADGEVLALACQGLSALGLSDCRLVLGDLGVFNQLLEEWGLSERARVFVLSHVGALREGRRGLEAVRERAQKFRLLSSGSQADPVLTEIGDLEETQVRALITSLLRQEEPGSLGQRQPDEVAEGLLHKLRGADDQLKLDKALELAAGLAAVQGEPQQALARAQDLLKAGGAGLSALHRLSQVVDLFRSEDVGGASVTVDFGLARGIAYYTGIVFELMDSHGSVSLGGGGRYDGLAKALDSAQDLPSVGFTYSLERLLENLGVTPDSAAPRKGRSTTLVVPGSPGAHAKALAVAGEIRAGNQRVETEVCDRTLEESLAYARAKGIDSMVEVSEAGQRKIYQIGSG